MKILQSLAIATLLTSVTSLSEATILKTSFYKSGRLTASGEKFSTYKPTAASNSYEFGTILQLSYNGKKTNVCINDNGNFAKHHRQLDVTKSVAKKLKFVKDGVVTLHSRVLFKPKTKISCQAAWGLL
jgi:rare lipoprotein A